MSDLVGRRVTAACNCGGGTVLVKPSERGCGGRRRLPCTPVYKRVVLATAALALLFASLAAPAGAQTPLCVDKATTGYAALEIASACFTKSGTTTVSPGSAVWVNGMLITPTNSGTLTLNSATGTLASSQPVTISIRCRSCDGQP